MRRRGPGSSQDTLQRKSRVPSRHTRVVVTYGTSSFLLIETVQMRVNRAFVIQQGDGNQGERKGRSFLRIVRRLHIPRKANAESTARRTGIPRHREQTGRDDAGILLFCSYPSAHPVLNAGERGAKVSPAFKTGCAVGYSHSTPAVSCVELL